MLKENHIDYKNSVISYKVIGEGKPVILIHGFAEDSSVWDEQVEHLKDKFKLVIPDLPGSGKSTILKNDRIRIEEYAECIKTILEVEGINQCSMIGHSMGGYITLAFAEKYSGNLVSMGLFHSSAYPDDAAKIEMRRKAIDFIRSNGPDAFLKTSIPGLFFDADKSKNDIEMLLEKGNNFTAEALIQYYEAMITRPDRTALLKTIDIPVLIIAGQHDKAVPFSYSLEQAKLPGFSYIHILRNSAHMGMLEETEKSNKILADFLQTDDVK